MSKITQEQKCARRHQYIQEALDKGNVVEVHFYNLDGKEIPTYWRSRRRSKVALYWAREHDGQEIIDDLGFTYRNLALYRGILPEEE